MVANFGWVLTIVVLPFPTEVAGLYSNDRFTSSLQALAGRKTHRRIVLRPQDLV
jgi:uncharacterized membrane protein